MCLRRYGGSLSSLQSRGLRGRSRTRRATTAGAQRSYCRTHGKAAGRSCIARSEAAAAAEAVAAAALALIMEGRRLLMVVSRCRRPHHRASRMEAIERPHNNNVRCRCLRPILSMSHGLSSHRMFTSVISRQRSSRSCVPPCLVYLTMST